MFENKWTQVWWGLGWIKFVHISCVWKQGWVLQCSRKSFGKCAWEQLHKWDGGLRECILLMAGECWLSKLCIADASQGRRKLGLIQENCFVVWFWLKWQLCSSKHWGNGRNYFKRKPKHGDWCLLRVPDNTKYSLDWMCQAVLVQCILICTSWSTPKMQFSLGWKVQLLNKMSHPYIPKKQMGTGRLGVIPPFSVIYWFK